MKPCFPSLQPLPGIQCDQRERRAARRVAERIIENGQTFYLDQNDGEVAVPGAVVAAWVLRHIGGYSITESDLIEHLAG